ncbi:PadR family transcriptional regulator [Pseudonocardia xishanensis]|uniref:PadR family transcriptional regulator n=1 Tax=Pseudonocardia xishanensis TaxID=630995 RepID=A0ABP8RUK8_9PSEU
MSLRHALLGVLSMREMSGYDIKRHFDRAVHFVWNASDSQIYRELRQMERGELIVSRVVPQEGKPNKRLYQLTDAGVTELDHWLASPVERPYSKEPFLLRLFFLSRVSYEDARKLLEARLGEVESLLDVAAERLQIFSDPTRSGRPEALWWQTRLIEGMRRVQSAEGAWLRELIRDLDTSQRNEAGEPGARGEGGQGS